MKLTNKKGVTLVELVIVFVIIAIGAALLTPAIGSWLSNYRLRNAARDITSTMRTAQMKAVSTNVEYRVSFANPSFWLERGNLSSGSTIWTAEGVTQTLPSGITMSGPLDGSNAHFNTNSTCSVGGSLTLTNTKGRQKKITLDAATARVKLE